MTLDQMRPGSRGKIKKLSVSNQLGQRLMDMGVCPGLQVRVVRNAPLEDPMEVELDGYFVSLRMMKPGSWRWTEVKASTFWWPWPASRIAGNQRFSTH